MMHVLNYCLFLYFRHNLYERQNFSNTTTSRCKLCKLGFFQYIFYQYSIIWIQLTFYFFNFIIRWSILGSTFLSKSLCIYNDIKKVIQYFWIDIFELIWNLIFPFFYVHCLKKSVLDACLRHLFKTPLTSLFESQFLRLLQRRLQKGV